jgi:hypothetical protein
MGPGVHDGAKLIHGGQNVHLWEKTAHQERRAVHEGVLEAAAVDLASLKHVHGHWNNSILPSDMYKRFAERAMEAHLRKQTLIVKKDPVADRRLADMWWDATFETPSTDK